MATLSIKEQLRKLVDIQTFDRDIYEIKQELKEKPQQLKDLQDEFEAKKARLKQLEEQIKRTQVDRNSRELELKTKEQEIQKADSHLSQLKSNKDYQAKLSEIEHLKADKSIIEEKILLSYDDVDALNTVIAKEKIFVTEEEKKYIAARKEIEDALKISEDKVHVLESKRKQLLPGVDTKILAQYERILDNKGGLAIVAVKNSVCGGCYMNIPMQQVNEVRSHERLVQCEMCARILYLEESL